MRLVCNFSPHVNDKPVLSLSCKQLKSVEYEILNQLHPVPQDWIDSITSLRKQEEVIIEKRKRLLTYYCSIYDPQIRKSLEQLHVTHPEIYI